MVVMVDLHRRKPQREASPGNSYFFLRVAMLKIMAVMTLVQVFCTFLWGGRVHRRSDEPTLPFFYPAKQCIAFGMFTRSTEFDIRNWQREMYDTHANRHRYSDRVDIRMRFAMASPSDPQTKQRVLEESNEYGDIILFDFEETEECMFLNRCLARNHDSLFRGILGLCDDKNYEASYFAKIDNDSVLNYELMARVFMEMPNDSVLFGRLLPNSAGQGKVERMIADFAQSYFPVWPHGSFQGFSRDLLLEMLRPENVATILRKEVNYVFPWSDRATGMEIARAQIPVQHKVFLKGHYYICPTEGFTCSAYWNSIAFHSGFGLSGKGSDKVTMKLQRMNEIYHAQSHCKPPYDVFRSQDHFFFVDDDFVKNGNSTYWLGYGCAHFDELANETLARFDRNYEEVEETMRPVAGTCAANLYQEQKEEFQRHSFKSLPASPQLGNTEERVADFARAFANKMIESGRQDSVDGDLRLQYIKEDYLSNSFHWFCPDDTSSCDREEMYLRRYPDVAEAVKSGIFQSGLEHFGKHGVEGSRTWACHFRYTDVGSGTVNECRESISEFIDVSTPLVQDWPIAGADDFELHSNCNAMVLVEGRDHPWMDVVLKNHRRYLGPYWRFYLVGPKEASDVWEEKYSGPMVEIVEIPKQFGTLSKYPDEYNELLLSTYLWENVVECENVLVTQTDAMLFRHGVEDFFEYDYVGSPIFSESFPTRYWRIMNAFNDTRVGGNGGFSFRKRSAMIEALHECPIPIPGSPEDAWSSACMLLLGRNLPHPTIANRFGLGTKCVVDVPLGGHKLWLNCKKSTCDTAIVQSRFHRDLYGEENSDYECPEGEQLYLSLYEDVQRAVKEGVFESGWEHYSKHGQFEQGHRIWRCMYPSKKSIPQGSIHDQSARLEKEKLEAISTERKCPKGETLYLKNNPDVAEAVKYGVIQSGWFHYINHGQQEGRAWICPQQT